MCIASEIKCACAQVEHCRVIEYFVTCIYMEIKYNRGDGREGGRGEGPRKRETETGEAYTDKSRDRLYNYGIIVIIT